MNRFTITRHTVATAAAVAVVAVVLGLLVWTVLRGRDAPTAAAVPPSPSAAAEPTPSAAASASPSASVPPAGESEQDRDLRRAGEAVVALQAKVDELAMGGTNASLTDLATYSRGKERAIQAQFLTGMRSRDERQVGTTAVRVSSAMYDEVSGIYKIRACVDQSGMDLQDAAGHSVWGKGDGVPPTGG